MRSWRHNSLYNPLNLTRWAPPLHFQDKDDDGTWMVLKKQRIILKFFVRESILSSAKSCSLQLLPQWPPISSKQIGTKSLSEDWIWMKQNPMKTFDILWVWCMICHLALALGKEESKHANMCVLILFHNLPNVTLCDHQPVPIKLERGGSPGHGQNISLDLAY